jgi:serine/threonine protein kinase
MMQHLQPNTTLQGGKYRIERVLGQGGFGITYLAVQTANNRYIAIKELFIGGSGQAINDRRGNQVVVTNSANQASFNQQREKFKKEALRLEKLNHPNLVKVYEFFEENGTAYYVMDYIEGESLRTKLNREGVLSESLVLKYLQQLLPALETAHKQNIWHLDIKPENIMVDRYGHVYLIDFGASKHVEPNSTLTTSLALAYTPGYCPPELLDLSNETPEYYLQAIKDIGPWTDIYALGATIYNLLTDSIPPSKRRLDKEGRKAFSFPNNVTSSTRDLIVWMMKPDKEDRPQSIRSLLVKVSSTEETLVENPIKEANFGSTNQSPKDSNRDKKFNANVLDHNDDSSLWKYVIVALLVGAMVAGYIYYNGNMSNNKPQVEKASYQDYFDK